MLRRHQTFLRCSAFSHTASPQCGSYEIQKQVLRYAQDDSAGGETKGAYHSLSRSYPLASSQTQGETSTDSGVRGREADLTIWYCVLVAMSLKTNASDIS